MKFVLLLTRKKFSVTQSSNVDNVVDSKSSLCVFGFQNRKDYSDHMNPIKILPTHSNCGSVYRSVLILDFM